MDMINFPNELTPLNVKAYFYNAFSACGCSELSAMIDVIRKALAWCEEDSKYRGNWAYLFNCPGIFYLIFGQLDMLELCKHGTSIRYPFLTDNGSALLAALNNYSNQEIECSSGTAYDDCSYTSDHNA